MSGYTDVHIQRNSGALVLENHVNLIYFTIGAFGTTTCYHTSLLTDPKYRQIEVTRFYR